jgi:hypothetical protein
MAGFTIIDEARATDVQATVADGSVLLTPDAVATALSWELKPEGFCRAHVCVPVREDSGVLRGGSVDLAAFASLLGRPIAVDVDERAAALGAAAHDRGAALATGEAPDFRLPDLAGRVHALSDFRGTKVFLAVWASW